MMNMTKEIIKKIAFKMFPHIKYYNERITNLELAFTAVAQSPEYLNDDDALNRQLRRKEIVTEVLTKMTPQSIVETGTHTGNTTGYFSKFAKRVYSSDSSPVYMWSAQNRLRKMNNIEFFIGDSRDFLKSLIEKKTLTPEPTFFYLDAHWHDDLPLYEEIKIIAENWKSGEWIILIDDFCVPGDSGYKYASYGPTKTLHYDYIKDLVIQKKLDVFYPSVSSDLETGYKTGYVFLSNGGRSLEILQKTANLKQT